MDKQSILLFCITETLIRTIVLIPQNNESQRKENKRYLKYSNILTDESQGSGVSIEHLSFHSTNHNDGSHIFFSFQT